MLLLPMIKNFGGHTVLYSLFTANCVQSNLVLASVAYEKKTMTPGHWLGSVLYVPFNVASAKVRFINALNNNNNNNNALTLMVGWQEEHPAHENARSTNPTGSFLKLVDEGPRRNWLTKLPLGNGY